MEAGSSMETEADEDVQNNLQMALILRDRMQNLSAGPVSGDEVTKIWNTLEIAAQEFEDFAEKHLKSYKRRKKPQDFEEDGTKSVVCRHSCSLYMELPNPALWGSLAYEMLQLMFSRLPVRNVRSFRCLSKDWGTIATTDSDFYRICDVVHGSLFAFISMLSYKLAAFWIRVYNVKSNKWDNFEIVIKRPVLAGLVRPAAASKWNSPLMNTRAMCGDGGLIIVSSETKSFKVFVLGDYKTPIYDDDADSDDNSET